MAIHNNDISIAKALGIILMVVGHSGCPSLLFKFIYLFHMPLFFFCSGYFYNGLNTKGEVLLFLKKRFIGLYIPFVKWSILFLLLHNIFLHIGIYNQNYGFEGGTFFYNYHTFIKKFFLIIFTMHDYEDLLGGFWFIRALFLSVIFISIASLFANKFGVHRNLVLVACFIVVTLLIRRFSPDLELMRDISMGTLGASFFMLGSLLHQYLHFILNKVIIFISVLLLFFSLFYFKDGVSMSCGYNKVIPFMLSSTAGMVLVLYISTCIDNKTCIIKRYLYYIVLSVLLYLFFYIEHGISFLISLIIDMLL